MEPHKMMLAVQDPVCAEAAPDSFWVPGAFLCLNSGLFKRTRVVFLFCPLGGCFQGDGKNGGLKKHAAEISARGEKRERVRDSKAVPGFLVSFTSEAGTDCVKAASWTRRDGGRRRHREWEQRGPSWPKELPRVE